MNSREECPMRHTNGNCLVIGGFCTSVNDEICNGLREAYECGASMEMRRNGWFSVKDRLPEQGKNVLVYIERNAYYRNGEIARKREIAIGWHIEGRWHVDGCSKVVGFYWQELPEPPKEVSE